MEMQGSKDQGKEGRLVGRMDQEKEGSLDGSNEGRKVR